MSKQQIKHLIEGRINEDGLAETGINASIHTHSFLHYYRPHNPQRMDSHWCLG